MTLTWTVMRGSYLMHPVSNLHFSHHTCCCDVADLLLPVKRLEKDVSPLCVCVCVYAQYTLV